MSNAANTETASNTETGLEWLDEIAALEALPPTAEEIAEEEAYEAAKAAKEAGRVAATRAWLIADGKFTVKNYRGADRCGRCSGRGILSGYEHICGGVCFACGGSGIK